MPESKARGGFDLVGGRKGEAARLGFLFARSGRSVRLRRVDPTRARQPGARWTSST
jgi:hypothetical protein